MSPGAGHRDALKEHLFIYYSDEDELYEPLWLHSPVRGYHDFTLRSHEQWMSVIDRHLPPGITEWNFDMIDSWCFQFQEFELRLRLDPAHSSFLHTRIINASESPPKRVIDQIKNQIQDLTAASVPQMTDFKYLAIVFLQALETTAGLLNEHCIATTPKTAQALRWDAKLIQNWGSILANPAGLDPNSIEDTQHEFLGLTPKEICERIPEEFRILHIESIRRKDLTNKWQEYRKELQDNLERESTKSLRNKLPPRTLLKAQQLSRIHRDDIIAELLRPQVTFHGTPVQNVPSIVRHGLKMPGSLINGQTVVSPRSGIAWERGIYSSPEPFYALSYAQYEGKPTGKEKIPGLRLFVCATLMGRTFSQSSLVHGKRQPGFDAHFDGTLEYIVHDSRAILPCYVIHLDLGAEEAMKAIAEIQADPWAYYESRKSQKHHKLTDELKSPGDMQRDKEAKKQAALKHFPYGYGPASGTSFVIEEIGYVSEDDEPSGTIMYDTILAEESAKSKLYRWWEEEGTGTKLSDHIRDRSGMILDQYQDDRFAVECSGTGPACSTMKILNVHFLEIL